MALGQSDIIRTLSGIETTTSFDPLIAEAETSAEFGAFAPELRLIYEGSQIDGPPESFFGPGISTETRYDDGNLTAELNKRWPLGTSTKLAYDPSSLGYLYFPDTDTGDSFNPAYGTVRRL